MFTTDLVNLYNRNIFKTSLYIYTFQDEKCRLMRNLSLSMSISCYSVSFQFRHFLLLRFCRSQTFCAVNFRDQAIILIHLFNMPCKNNFNQTFILWFKSASIGFGDQTISLHKFRPLFLYSSYNHLGKFEEFLKIYFEIHEELNPFLVWVLIIFLILIIMLARSISWKHPSNSNFSEIYYNLVFFLETKESSFCHNILNSYIFARLNYLTRSKII